MRSRSTLALTGIGAAGASTARVHPNGTPSCGADCLNVSNLLYGPAQVLNAKANGKVVLRHASNSYSFEDCHSRRLASRRSAQYRAAPG